VGFGGVPEVCKLTEKSAGVLLFYLGCFTFVRQKSNFKNLKF
jgi:hypothetical protein